MSLNTQETKAETVQHAVSSGTLGHVFNLTFAEEENTRSQENLQSTTQHETPCEECEDASAILFCKSCEQNLCSECDTKIHNKGKRAQHSRQQLKSLLDFLRIKSIVLVTQPFLGLKPSSDGDKLTKSIFEYIHTQLQPYKLESENTFVYACYNKPTDSKLEENTQKGFSRLADHVTAIDVTPLKNDPRHQEIKFDNEVLSFVKEEQISEWAKIFNLLTRGISLRTSSFFTQYAR